jgi:hypothetical protein
MSNLERKKTASQRLDDLERDVLKTKIRSDSAPSLRKAVAGCIETDERHLRRLLVAREKA